MKKTFLSISISLFFAICLHGQDSKRPYCTADDIKHNKTTTSQLRQEQIEAVPDTAKLVRIPVVFNIVNVGEKIGDSTNVSAEVIKTNLEELNNYYRNRIVDRSSPFYNPKGIDTKVEFYLPDLDSSCNYSTGIRRYNGSNLPRYKEIGITYENTNDGFNNDDVVKKASGTDTKRFLNVWIVNTIFSKSTVIGYANYPEGYISEGSSFGIVATWSNIRGVLVHEVGHFLGLSHEDMAVDGLNGLHAFQIIRKSANFYAQKLLGKPISCTPKNQTDIGLVEVKGFSRAQCTSGVLAKVKIKNYGSSVIQSCKIKLVGNNITLQDFTWTGNLIALDTTWVSLPLSTLAEGTQNIQAFAYSVNNISDAIRANDTLKLKTQIVKAIPYFPWANDLNSNTAPLSLSSGSRSNSSWQTGIGLSNSSAILLEGKDRLPRNGVVPDGAFYSLAPFDKRNDNYHAYADVCINTSANKHYKVKFMRFHDSWGPSYFRTLSNNSPTQTSAVAGDFAQWFYDSTIVSSDNNSSILLSFQSACDNSYATKAKYGSGDYIIIDNINITETPATAFKMDFTATPNIGCAPMFPDVINKSFGAPLPTMYKFYLSRNGVVFDSTITLDTRIMYVPVVTDAIYGMKVVAIFKDGKTSTLNLPNFVNATNSIINTSFGENFETTYTLRPSNNSSFKNLDWQIANQGAFGKSNKSIMINQIDQTTGWGDLKLSLEAGPFDFSGLKNGFSLRYDRAYAADYLSTALSEYLSVEYSLDCGKNWKEAGKKSGDKLMTTAYKSSHNYNVFIPTATEWATDVYNIDTIAGKKNVQIKFIFHPQFGSAIYLDNIMFGDKTIVGLEKVVSQRPNSVNVFPNPSSSVIHLNSDIPIVQINIYDTFGTQIIETQSSSINIEQLCAGVYTGTILNTEGQTRFFKFVKTAK